MEKNKKKREKTINKGKRDKIERKKKEMSI